jgi:hypothetical protein
MRSKKTAATDVNRLVSSASTLPTEIVDENEAFVTSIVNVEQFVQAIFDILLPDIVFAEDYSVVLRLAADKGGSTTKVIFSFLLSERANSPFPSTPWPYMMVCIFFYPYRNSMQGTTAKRRCESQLATLCNDSLRLQRFAGENAITASSLSSMGIIWQLVQSLDTAVLRLHSRASIAKSP